MKLLSWGIKKTRRGEEERKHFKKSRKCSACIETRDDQHIPSSSCHSPQPPRRLHNVAASIVEQRGRRRQHPAALTGTRVRLSSSRRTADTCDCDSALTSTDQKRQLSLYVPQEGAPDDVCSSVRRGAACSRRPCPLWVLWGGGR